MKCKICNQELKSIKALVGHLRYKHDNFPAKDYYDKYLKTENEGVCITCKVKPTSFISMNKGYREYCSQKCISNSPKVKEKFKQTCLEKFGVENPIQNKDCLKKRENTCIERYGEINVFKSEKIKQKIKTTFEKNYKGGHPSRDVKVRTQIKETCRKRYGVDSFLSSSVFRVKRIETWKKKYNKERPFQDINIKEKIETTCKKRYGLDYNLQFQKKREKTFAKNHDGLINPFQLISIRRKAEKVKKQKRFKEVIEFLKFLKIELLEPYQRSQYEVQCKCLRCNTVFKSCLFYLNQGYGYCPTCYPRNRPTGEHKLRIFIKSLGLNVQNNIKSIIRPQELDIYIPEKKIAIEYNGVYWHSEKVGKGKNYHLNKLKLCNEKGIRLVQIFEDEWLFKQDIVKARLKQILNVSNAKRVHARQCFIKEISTQVKNEFLEKYHIQGKDSSTVKLGAFYNESLVSVMTFSKGSIAKGSKSKEKVWELNRFCVNYSYHIPGIASKLLTHFKRNYEWAEIFSYADRRWSVGNLYYKLGFELEKETRPNYWYTKGKQRIHRFSLRKRFDEPKDTPEWFLRAKEGYMRVWDCGHLKFVIKND